LTQHFRIHGLHIRSDRTLDADVVENVRSDGDVDLDVTWGHVMPAESSGPDGELVAGFDAHEGANFRMVKSGDEYVFRFYRFADVVFDAELRSAVVYPHEGADDDVVPLLITGAVAAFVLEMRGMCVLHASAVEHDGRAIAFAGPSGAGKTTAAALASVAGAPLLADDVLHVEFADDGSTWCYAGARALRLRPVVVGLADLVPDAPRAPTPDGRVALQLAAGRHEKTPLAAVVMPRVTAEAERLCVERLSGADALIALTTAPRLVGFVGDHARGQFERMGELAHRLPVFSAVIPWAPGRDASVATELFDRLDSLLA